MKIPYDVYTEAIKEAKERDRKVRAVEATLRYRKKHPEKRREADKRYRDSHKEQRKAWNDANKEKCRLHSTRSRNKKALEG